MDILVGCDGKGVQFCNLYNNVLQAKTDQDDLLSYIKPVFSGLPIGLVWI